MRALLRSAALSQAQLGRLEVDREGAPLPSGGWHWSISHSSQMACAAVARGPIGIDVEPIRERREELVEPVLGTRELERLGGFSWEVFTRAWTAKEAVLKRAGCGLAELSGCELVALTDQSSCVVRHRGREHEVAQHRHEGHVFALSFETRVGTVPACDWSLETTLEQEPEVQA